MRRIIERVVTVVTTTTWTITWQDDPSHPGPQSDSADENLSQPQLPSRTQQSDPTNMTESAKEVGASETKK